MKSVIIGVLLVVVISAIAWGALQSLTTSSSEAYRSANQSVRLD